MPFFQDNRYSEPEAQQAYGRYLKTFKSENAQVRVDLFEYGDRLFAYTSFAPGLDESTVTDPWISVIHGEALTLGYAGKLQLVFLAAPLEPTLGSLHDIPV